MACLNLIFALSLLTFAGAEDASSKRHQFAVFKKQYGKTYGSSAEETERFEVFSESLARIEKLNALNVKGGGKGDVFGITYFADRYQHEKPARGRKDHGANVVYDVPVHKHDGSPLPKSIDWRISRAVTPVKNQGQCGSCWAFSTAETVESAYYLSQIGADVPILLSPQQIASCVTSMDGCGGGDTVVAFDYLKSEPYGLAPLAFWGYAQGLTPLGACSTKACTEKCSSHNLTLLEKYSFYTGPSAKISGFSYATKPCTGTCSHQNLEDLASSLHANGPVSVCVNAGVWDDYVGGILTAKACGSMSYDSIDHCVQLVGYNSTEKSFLVRNSWSASWGEQGYIRLQFANTCGVADEATNAIISGQDTEQRKLRHRRLACIAASNSRASCNERAEL